MTALFSWLACGNDDTPWTNVTTDGTATLTGTPITKEFQKTLAFLFNTCGHYQTTGIAAAAGLRFITYAKISSTTNTDVMIAGVNRNTASIGFARSFYISGSSLYLYINGHGSVIPPQNDPSPMQADRVYKFEIRITASGSCDWYVDNVLVGSNIGLTEDGTNFTTGTLRHFLNLAQCNLAAGVVSLIAAYITDASGFPQEITENFANLDSWTLRQADGTVTVSGNEMILDLTTGGAPWEVNGAVFNTPFLAVDGLVLEVKTHFPAWPINSIHVCESPGFEHSVGAGIPFSNGIEFASSSAKFHGLRGHTNTDGSGASFLPAAGATPDAEYTLRMIFEDVAGQIQVRAEIEGDGIAGVGNLPEVDYTPFDWTGKEVWFYLEARQAAAVNTYFKEMSASVAQDEGVSGALQNAAAWLVTLPM